MNQIPWTINTCMKNKNTKKYLRSLDSWHWTNFMELKWKTHIEKREKNKHVIYEAQSIRLRSCIGYSFDCLFVISWCFFLNFLSKKYRILRWMFHFWKWSFVENHHVLVSITNLWIPKTRFFHCCKLSKLFCWQKLISSTFIQYSRKHTDTHI